MRKHLFLTRALSVGQCGILTMIDTPTSAIFMREKIFKNVETPLPNQGFVSRTVWNTNDDRYSDFGHFLKMWKRLYGDISTFLDFGHFLEMSLYRNVATFLDFAYFLKVCIFHVSWFCPVSSILSSLCGILRMIDTSISVIFWKCGNVSTFLDFAHFWKCGNFSI